MPGRPPKAFGPEHTRADVIAYARELESELDAQDEEHVNWETAIGQMRSCRDPLCCLCRECVVALQVRLKPPPLTVPRKYVVSQWRR